MVNNIILDFHTPYSLRNKILRFIWNVCWTIFARPFPKSSANLWKVFILRCFGAKITNTSYVYSSAKIFMPWNLIMEDHSCIGAGVDCYNASTITIKSYATISQRAYLCTASHNISSIHNEQIEKPIIIGSRSWIAAEAFIGPGVIIGEGAVVGARAVVFKNVDPWNVVVGNPARFKKNREIK